MYVCIYVYIGNVCMYISWKQYRSCAAPIYVSVYAYARMYAWFHTAITYMLYAYTHTYVNTCIHRCSYSCFKSVLVGSGFGRIWFW